MSDYQYLKTKLKGDDGKSHCLSDFLGKKVVLYFYPKDRTPGCTRQSCNYTESMPEFDKMNTVVIGCSFGTVETKKRFKDQNMLNHLLLSLDGNEEFAKFFGTFQLSIWKKPGLIRSTFVLNETGEIVYKKFNTSYKYDTDEVVEFIKSYIEASNQKL